MNFDSSKDEIQNVPSSKNVITAHTKLCLGSNCLKALAKCGIAWLQWE
jgi:hypothetical protein